ncbi:MAG: tyrosine--tRNA ligase [Actinobacteria bacterium]|nr:MAG: tyrosine--tRNA ligase [Actinomycetota bacterium]
MDTRGQFALWTPDDLPQRLEREKVTFYLGIDATADSLHAGQLVGLMAVRRLQQAGHRPILLLGGGTTLVGDPSGKDAERPLLGEEQIQANAAAIRAQLERFVDFGAGGALLLDNADWLRDLRLMDFLRDIGKHVTVNVMMGKESVRTRLEGREQGISYTEFSYMLLQAYDFLSLFREYGCRMQVGGTDQWGNITLGIDLIRRMTGDEAYGLAWPLLTKADGSKFGKSESGAIWLAADKTSPYDFFQYWMNASDDDVATYLRLFTDLSEEEMGSLLAAPPEQRAAQRRLAHELTATVHGQEGVDAAERTSTALFGGDPTTLSEEELLSVYADAPSSEGRLDGATLLDLFAEALEGGSKSAARRTAGQGGAYVNNRQERDLDRPVTEDDLLAGRSLLLRKGRKRYHLVRFG